MSTRKIDPAAAYLEAEYGPDFRKILGLVEHPHAETDESAFEALFPDYPAAVAAAGKKRKAA